MVVQGGGQVVEAGQLLALHFLLFLGEHLRLERLLVFEQMPEHPRQVDSLTVARSALRAFTSGEFLSRVVRSSVRHRRDRLGAAKPRLPAPHRLAQPPLLAAQRVGRQPQDVGCR